MVNKEERFKQIVSENEGRIMRLCRYYAHEAEDIKDIYQEILINIWKSLDSYRGDAAISTWIYRIAINTSLNFSGKFSRHPKLKVDIDNRNLGNLVLEEETENKLLLETQIEKLHNELNQLSVIDKAIISLLLENLSSKEIASIIGLTETNIRVKIHRIKEQLKQSVGFAE